MLGVCWLQRSLCFTVQRFFGAEKVVWADVREDVWGGRRLWKEKGLNVGSGGEAGRRWRA